MYAPALLDLRRRLEREHVELIGQFKTHQESLVNRESHRALDILVNFEHHLANHMELEERYLLPLCEPEIDRPGHWGVHVYAQEHRKIKASLASLRLRIAGYCAEPAMELTPSDVIALLDEEKVLKHLISHHQMREQTALYPRIFDEALA
jgi:iron-sulfur cluster repair protein YtfE (RIC family)